MGTSLAGKTAIVTGGSRGIGRAIAERLGADGASVVLTYARQREKAEEVVAAVEASGGKARAARVDLSRLGDIRSLFSKTLDECGRLDILVNNAGTAAFGPLQDVTERDFDALFAVNVKGVFFALAEAARCMADGGRIINISSGITILGGAGGALYGGSKGAVEQFALAAARELGPRGITVNTVSPGGTETDLLHQVVPREAQKQMAQSSPMGRLGRPEDIADVVAFLASDAGRWVTGQNIRANGGAT